MGEYKVRLKGNTNSIREFALELTGIYQTTENASVWDPNHGCHVFQLYRKEGDKDPVDYMHELAAKYRIKLELIN